MRMGDILLNGGKRDEALADFNKALALRQKFADKEPDDTVSQDGLAIAEAKIGDVASADGRYDDAVAAYDKSVAITQKLADHHPSPRWQRELATCYERLGGALERQGKHDAAMADFKSGWKSRKSSSTATRTTPSGSGTSGSRMARSAMCCWRRTSRTRPSSHCGSGSRSRKS